MKYGAGGAERGPLEVEDDEMEEEEEEEAPAALARPLHEDLRR